MTIWVKQSTALTLKFGPFVDSTDGVTAETALTITQAEVRLAKNGGAFAQKSETTSLTHAENGYYTLLLDTTDTNTLGTLLIAVNESGALPVWERVMVVPANVWDSYFGSDRLQVHVDEMTAGIITAAVIATNAVDADALATDAITEIQSGLATSASQTTIAGYIDTEVAAIKAKTDNLPASPAATGDIPSAATIAAAVWDRLTSALTTVGSIGKLLVDNVNDTISSRASQTSVDTVDDFLDTEIAAIKAKTDNLPAAPAAVGDIPTAAAIADAVLDDAITEPAGVFTWGGATLRNITGWLGALSRNKQLQTDTTTTLRNDADNADLATSTISDDGTTFTRGEFS